MVTWCATPQSCCHEGAEPLLVSTSSITSHHFNQKIDSVSHQSKRYVLPAMTSSVRIKLVPSLALLITAVAWFTCEQCAALGAPAASLGVNVLSA